MEHFIQLPLTKEKAAALRCGDTAYLTGVLYTGRDAAHKRMTELLEAGQALPFDMQDAVLYYVGPTPAAPGQVIGSAGPTTSYRMDEYTPALLAQGLRGMIGKGRRSPQVIQAMQKTGAVYLAAIGGAGALITRCIRSAQVIAFEDLGPEAIHRLSVENFPVVVAIDASGANLYERGPAAYLADSPSG